MLLPIIIGKDLQIKFSNYAFSCQVNKFFAISASSFNLFEFFIFAKKLTVTFYFLRHEKKILNSIYWYIFFELQIIV
ncbi:hypothetical protein JL58_02415 [Listeria ivanovii subsp. londoniensis]|nr:hypothetical protein JL58_02415 [Listeria ivanovii subsp. londoniensis]